MVLRDNVFILTSSTQPNEPHIYRVVVNKVCRDKHGAFDIVEVSLGNENYIQPSKFREF